MENTVCGDNRFEIIEKAKKDLLDKTNIKDSPKEMEVLDRFLFRCWQMGWLETPKISAEDVGRIFDKVRELQINYSATSGCYQEVADWFNNK